MPRSKLAPDDPRHGTYNGYQNLECRCDRCREANTVYHAAYVERTGYRLPRSVPRETWNEAIKARHGTETRYKTCRCDPCREAATTARRERRRLSANG